MLTQDSNTTSATAPTTFNIKYSLDGCLMRDVEKSHVSVVMLGTRTHNQTSSDSSNPSFAISTTMNALSTNQPQYGAQSRATVPPLKNFCSDELWIAVKNCWENFPMDAFLARGYVHHGQMASALIACNGSDNFVLACGGLHCNVCNCCATVCDENGELTGVQVVRCLDDSANSGGGGENPNTDTMQQQKMLQ